MTTFCTFDLTIPVFSKMKALKMEQFSRDDWIRVLHQVSPPNKSLQFLVTVRLPNVYFSFGNLFFWPTGKYVIHCIRGDQMSDVQSMVAKRGLTNRANVHTLCKSCLKHSPAEFQSLQQFWLQLDIVS